MGNSVTVDKLLAGTRANGFFSILEVGYNMDYLRGDGLYCVPELGMYAATPRSLANFGAKLKRIGENKVLTGRVLTKVGNEFVPAGPTEQTKVFIVGRGEDYYDIVNGNVSIYQASKEQYFSTNQIAFLDDVELGDKITAIDGIMTPVKKVTKEVMAAITGNTYATDALAQEDCVVYFEVFVDNYQRVTDMYVTTSVGQPKLPKNKLMLIAQV